MTGYTPPADFAAWGSEQVAALYAAARKFGQVGIPVEVPSGAVVVDAHRLRGYGAKLDGSDDAAAVQAAINAAGDWCPAVYICPSILIDLPAGAVLGLGSTVSSGACNVMLRGAGPFISEIRWLGGAGVMWQHGTPAVPAIGYLHLNGLMIRDGTDAGSGAVGLSAYLSNAVLQKCVTLEALHFRHWTAPIRITNAQRGPTTRNVSVFAPDYALVPGAAFEVATDAIGYSFDGSYTDVMTVGYTWGWRFTVANPLEGQKFSGCNAYNGWGLAQVNVTAGGGYKSLFWSFTDCDWQGLGFFLDLNNCRQVTVRGGFWICNPNTAGLATPNGAPRRRYLSFKGCENVRLHDLEFDVSGSMEASLSLVHVDHACQDVRVLNSIVRCYSPIYAFLEVEPNPSPNTVSEVGTSYFVWVGGTKVLEAGADQACETIANGALWPTGQVGVVSLCAAPSPTGLGSYQIDGVTGGLTVDANGSVYVPFPTRPGANPFFIGGTPTLVISANNSHTNAPVPSISYVSATGFTVQYPSGNAGTTVSISYSTKGI